MNQFQADLLDFATRYLGRRPTGHEQDRLLALPSSTDMRDVRLLLDSLGDE